MEDKVVVLDVWESTYGMRVRISLAEKGIEYEVKEENLDDKSSLLLESNPVNKTFPVLIHNGKPVCESLIIVQYIDEVWTHKSLLLPSDPYQRSHARFWVDYIDKKTKMEDEVVLLYLWASSYGMRVRIPLAKKGIEYEAKEENLADKSSLLLESNPVHKLIPVLIHIGKPVCESLVTVQYIDEVWTLKSPLLPSDPYQRSQAKFWADYVDQKVFNTCKCLWRRKGEEQEKYKKEFIEGLKTLEGELGQKPYFGGDGFGFVDVALVPISCWFHTFETFAYFSVESELPKIPEWVKRCFEKESEDT